MPLCLPPLAHGQTLYSWCAQTCAWNLLPSARATSFRLFESPSAALCHDFPAHLDILVGRFPEASFDADEIALNHTLLGYFLSVQSKSIALNLLSSVRCGALPSLKMRLGITASRVGGRHPLKACDECISSDLERIGFASWHLAHQFPSAMICLIHQRPLFLASDPVSPVHRRDWLLPTSANWRRTDLPVLGKKQIQELLRLADYSSRLWAQGVDRFDPERLATTYQAGLRQQGLCTSGGSLRLKPLVRLASQQFKGLAALPGFEFLHSMSESDPGLLGTIARTTARRAHPLKHLLLITLAFESWADFEGAYDAPSARSAPPEPSPIEMDSLAERLRVLVATEHLAITKAARKLGASPTKALELARRESIPFVARPKKLRGPVLTKLRAQLERGTTVAVACKNTGLSNVTISRLLASNPELQRLWTSARLEQERARARSAFRNAARSSKSMLVSSIRTTAGSKYWWLFAHDRKWLSQETARITRARTATH